MNGKTFLQKLEAAWNLDSEVYVNTPWGEFKVFDIIGTMSDEITIECVNPNTGNTMENKYGEQVFS